MNTVDIADDNFRKAVEAIDSGDMDTLQGLIEEHPLLLSDPLINHKKGYFKNPYLLYFVAGNPIRIDRLPGNIVDMTKFIIGQLKYQRVASLQEQLDYTLGLVATGLIPKQSGVQLSMMDLLIDEGAHAGMGLAALANGNMEAAKHLISKGSPLTLPVAVGLDLREDVATLLVNASDDEKLTALVVAAFFGQCEMVALLLSSCVDPNRYPTDGGFHHHGTALHQAVSSGCLNCVTLLVEAGVDTDLKDTIYQGTPLDWAIHMHAESVADERKQQRYAAIGNYLQQFK